MKVLSVKQPWAYLICSGIKDIENRTWECPQKYIGERVLIHASGTAAKEPYMLFNDDQAEQIGDRIMDVVASYHTRSAIIGSVEIVDCVINHPSIWAEKTERIVLNESWPSGRPACAGKKGDTYNWVLANPILFDKPILNVKGKLGFWNYDLPEEYETILKL